MTWRPGLGWCVCVVYDMMCSVAWTRKIEMFSSCYTLSPLLDIDGLTPTAEIKNEKMRFSRCDARSLPSCTTWWILVHKRLVSLSVFFRKIWKPFQKHVAREEQILAYSPPPSQCRTFRAHTAKVPRAACADPRFPQLFRPAFHMLSDFKTREA